VTSSWSIFIQLHVDVRDNNVRINSEIIKQVSSSWSIFTQQHVDV